MHQPALNHRDPRLGMTMVELLISLAVFGIVIGVALSAMARENAAYREGTDRMSAVRAIRFAMTTVETDLSTLGTNVPEGQPEFVYGGPDVVAFTADYATNIAQDPFAVYFNPGAPFGQVTLPSAQIPIPNSSAVFPLVSYDLQPGVPSPAEFIVFYMEEDTGTPEGDDYILFRQVNGAEPERVAGGLRRFQDQPFFRYLRLKKTPAGATTLQEVPIEELPLHHSEPAHLSPADTAGSAVADSVRAVRLTFAAVGGRDGSSTREVPVSRLIPLENAGFGKLNTCGAPPLLGVGLSATVGTNAAGDPIVTLNWSAAIDEAQGEQDVVRYVIYRRLLGDVSWGEPYVAIPGGGSPYTYEDASLSSGTTYEYALAAQDCTPNLSTITPSNPVVVP